MSSACRRGWLCLARAAMVAFVVGSSGGCKGTSTPPEARSHSDPDYHQRFLRWARYWDGLKERTSIYGLGTEFELLEIEQTPSGTTQTTVVWVLDTRGPDSAHFEVRADGTTRRANNVYYHPSLDLPVGYVEGQDPLVTLSTPAGEFRCARVSLDVRRKGEVEVDLMRDVWRAPNVPVPIQTWERPRAAAEGDLRDPPGDPSSMPIGCTLSRLVAVRPGRR